MDRITAGGIPSCISLLFLVLTAPAHGQTPLELQVQVEWQAQENQPLRIPLGATGGQDNDYTFNVDAAGLGHIEGRNTYVWTPGFGVASTTSPTSVVRIPLRVDNRSGETDRQEITIKVTNLNRPPTTDGLPIAWVSTGVRIEHSIGARDEDGDVALQYSKRDNAPDAWPATAELTADGRFIWTPSALELQQAANRSLGFQVKDPSDATALGTLQVRLQPTDAPPIVEIREAPNKIREFQQYELRFFAKDPNGLPLTVTVIADNTDVPLVEAQPTGDIYTYNWTPNYDFVSPPNKTNAVTFTITANDGTSGTPTILQQHLTVQNAVDACEAFEEFDTHLVLAAALLMQVEGRVSDIQGSLWWRDALNMTRSLVTAVLGGWTGKAAADESTGATGLAGALTAGWVVLSGSIPSLSSADEVRAQRTALQSTEIEIKRIAQDYARTYRTPSSRESDEFFARSEALRSAVQAANERHQQHNLPSSPNVQDSDVQAFFQVLPQQPASCVSQVGGT